MDFSDDNPFMFCARRSVWKNLGLLSCVYDCEPPELHEAHEMAFDLAHGVLVPAVAEAHRAFEAGDDTGQELETLVQFAIEGRLLLVKAIWLLENALANKRTEALPTDSEERAICLLEREREEHSFNELKKRVAESDEKLRQYAGAVFVAHYDNIDYIIDEVFPAGIDSEYLNEWWMARERLDRNMPEHVVINALCDLRDDS